MNEWFSAAELAQLELSGMPASKRGVNEMAERDQWTRAEWNGSRWRPRAGRGGGVEFHFRVLPLPARVELVKRLAKRQAADPRAIEKGEFLREEMWSRFERMSNKKKDVAKRRLLMLRTIRLLTDAGTSRGDAFDHVARANGVSKASLYNYEATVRGYHKSDWMAVLVPGCTGRQKDAEMTPEALDALKALYFRLEKPNFENCWRHLEKIAKAQGWTLPSKRTAQRRLDEVPEAVRVLCREGDEALGRLYPAQERDRSGFHAMEAVNMDGHKWDVFVRWPDGAVGRVIMAAIQDLYSGKFLSWRYDRSENQEMLRLAIGDMVEDFGIPDHIYLDNGRGFAAKCLTGGVQNRYRFKVNEDDPTGILPQLGVQVHWTKPYSGQSKPIERGFRDFAQDIAKHPAFAGAWCGNGVDAKPENYGSAAIPIEEFMRVVDGEIAEHNMRAGRRSAVCRGRSFDDVFAESYAAAPIRKASEMQRRLWLMAAEGVTVARTDGSVTIMDNRFWAEELVELRGQKVVARFDPQALHGDLHVYRLNGDYVCAAPCVHAAGFADVDAARAHGRDRAAYRKAVKAMRAAEVRTSISDVAAMLPSLPPPADPPAPRVVKLTWGATALAARPAEDLDPPEDALMKGLAKQAAARRAAGVELRVVEGGDD